ncbi:SDR family NAD(P)-dependent oxidoreductase [Catellatospora vulcania]|uniref:SDR family NAD(P)-dependent oxidoreductase n=1 Tax=Catellatospora vulcania TaxID=1460450 RepID=UPI0012D3B141|nr:SDR family NAD(P)-dependent oxidoreductase [Catellatospora vulcania]
MRTLVITGGTQGIGRGLALHHLSAGDRVVAVGSSQAKGASLRAEAQRLGAADRFTFRQADLSSAAATADLAAALRQEYPQLDALVLGAFRFEQRRRETAEGLERTFALYVLSRFLLAEGLRPALERALRPVVVNLCGTGGIRAGRLHWDDLQLTRRYRPFDATMQGARANDLLGAAFAAEQPGSAVRYVLYNPLFVDTGLADGMRQPARAAVKAAARLFATPVARAVPPIVALLDEPPPEPLSAWRVRRRVDVTGPAFDPGEARRLTEVLRRLAAAPRS